MTIKEKGYTHWDGEFVSRKFPWWPMTRSGIRLTFQRRFFKLLYVLTLTPAIVFMVGVYLAERLEDFRINIEGSSQLLRVDPSYFKAYLTNEFLMFMVAIVLVFAGAGLIADDLKHNSLQLYFSRPIKKQDYIFGKASVLVFFLSFVSLVPALILYVLKILFSGSLKFVGEYPLLPLSILSYSLLMTAFFTLYTLLISSVSKNRRYVIILIIGIYFFSDMLFAIFYEIFHSSYFSLLSLKINLQQLGAAIFGLRATYDVHWGFSLAIVAGICFLAGLVLARKVKGVEIVK